MAGEATKLDRLFTGLAAGEAMPPESLLHVLANGQVLASRCQYASPELAQNSICKQKSKGKCSSNVGMSQNAGTPKWCYPFGFPLNQPLPSKTKKQQLEASCRQSLTVRLSGIGLQTALVEEHGRTEKDQQPREQVPNH